MARRNLAVLLVMIMLPLAACSARGAGEAQPAYPGACKDFRSWFAYVGGDVASQRSGADSILAAAVTMSFRGQLHRELSAVRSYAARTRKASSSSMLAADRSLAIRAVRRVQTYCRTTRTP